MHRTQSTTISVPIVNPVHLSSNPNDLAYARGSQSTEDNMGEGAGTFLCRGTFWPTRHRHKHRHSGGRAATLPTCRCRETTMSLLTAAAAESRSRDTPESSAQAPVPVPVGGEVGTEDAAIKRTRLRERPWQQLTPPVPAPRPQLRGPNRAWPQ